MKLRPGVQPGLRTKNQLLGFMLTIGFHGKTIGTRWNPLDGEPLVLSGAFNVRKRMVSATSSLIVLVWLGPTHRVHQSFAKGRRELALSHQGDNGSHGMGFFFGG